MNVRETMHCKKKKNIIKLVVRDFKYKTKFLTNLYKVGLQLLLLELLSTEAVAMGADNHCHTYIH